MDQVQGCCDCICDREVPKAWMRLLQTSLMLLYLFIDVSAEAGLDSACRETIKQGSFQDTRLSLYARRLLL